MSNRGRLAAGAALATMGGLGIVLSTILGWTNLARPWSFLIGFGFGLAAGLGAALSLVGLVSMRRCSKGNTES
ncbi:hypothetical protein ACFLSZ_00715 [Candidatus Bipolaricaulota bacterium]